MAPQIMSTNLSSIEQRVLDLLSSGVTPSQCASALGISESRVSQLLSVESFAQALAANRFESLKKHNARDSDYDEMEDKLIKQFKAALPMIMDPMKMVRALQLVNQMKRRGSSSVDAIVQKQTVIQLQMPVVLVNRFKVNGNNQVISVGAGQEAKEMVTIQSGHMKMLRDKLLPPVAAPLTLENESEKPSAPASFSKFGFE